MPGTIQLRNHQKVSVGPTMEGRKVQASDSCSSHMQGLQVGMQHRGIAPLHSAVACRLWAAMAWMKALGHGKDDDALGLSSSSSSSVPSSSEPEMRW